MKNAGSKNHDVLTIDYILDFLLNILNTTLVSFLFLFCFYVTLSMRLMRVLLFAVRTNYGLTSFNALSLSLFLRASNWDFETKK